MYRIYSIITLVLSYVYQVYNKYSVPCYVKSKN